VLTGAAKMNEIETQALTFIVRDLRLKACYKTITRRFIVRPTWHTGASVFINKCPGWLPCAFHKFSAATVPHTFTQKFVERPLLKWNVYSTVFYP